MSNNINGIIYKGIGGFYTVKTTHGQMLQCQARGALRNQGQKPLAGDEVVLEKEAETFIISKILPRKNAMLRPPLANVAQLFIVVSTVQPVPSFLVIDKLAASAINMGASPVIVVTKTDMSSPMLLQNAYETSKIPFILAYDGERRGLKEIKAMFKNKLSAFCGNSGVGKSTLINAVAPQLSRNVAPISQKLGRGKHTTREVELFELEGGLVADTPGFASFDAQSAGQILPENIQLCFPEIKALIGQCKFSGCAHVADAGCAVLKAVEEKRVSSSRHSSYITLYTQAKQVEKTF